MKKVKHRSNPGEVGALPDSRTVKPDFRGFDRCELVPIEGSAPLDRRDAGLLKKYGFPVSPETPIRD